MNMYRLYEFIPGSLAWGTVIGIIVLSWLAPLGVAIFIIVFDIYWFLKTAYFSLHLRATFKEMRRRMGLDLISELEKLDIKGKNWHEMYHLVILPMYNEPYDVVRESFARLANVNYPKEKLIVVLATEERVPEGRQVAERIQAEFGSVFSKFFVTAHPFGIEGELPGKGSNETWAAKQVKRDVIDPQAIPYEHILVSVFDVDTQVQPEYFGVLTHSFFTAPHPQRSSYQPIPLFTNNVFQAPALARVISFSSTFWHMIQQSRPDRLTTFSSHSMPFKALVDVGFWNTNVVSEDSQIFWQCFLHYDGDWRVVPIFYPLSMDANMMPTFWGTLRNLYKQQRRWGWGCENIPYLLAGFRNNPRIPLRTKLYWAFQYIEGFHSWSTNALIIFSLGWLPIFLGGSAFRVSLLSFNLPRITRTIMSVAMFGIASSAALSIAMLPPRPAWFGRKHYFLYVIQWILTPLTLIIFGAFPAFDAQTRLMLGGKYRLGFWVTPKYRESDTNIRWRK